MVMAADLAYVQSERQEPVESRKHALSRLSFGRSGRSQPGIWRHVPTTSFAVTVTIGPGGRLTSPPGLRHTHTSCSYQQRRSLLRQLIGDGEVIPSSYRRLHDQRRRPRRLCSSPSAGRRLPMTGILWRAWPGYEVSSTLTVDELLRAAGATELASGAEGSLPEELSGPTSAPELPNDSGQLDQPEREKLAGVQ
jgi:hypothetical protein